MTLLRVHTQTLSHCPQCHMTLRVAESKGVRTEERPGIDTPDRERSLTEFKNTYGLSSAPIVEAVVDGVVVERWAGFRPDRIEAYA